MERLPARDVGVVLNRLRITVRLALLERIGGASRHVFIIEMLVDLLGEVGHLVMLAVARHRQCGGEHRLGVRSGLNHQFTVGVKNGGIALPPVEGLGLGGDGIVDEDAEKVG